MDAITSGSASAGLRVLLPPVVVVRPGVGSTSTVGSGARVDSGRGVSVGVATGSLLGTAVLAGLPSGVAAADVGAGRSAVDDAVGTGLSRKGGVFDGGTIGEAGELVQATAITRVTSPKTPNLHPNRSAIRLINSWPKAGIISCENVISSFVAVSMIF